MDAQNYARRRKGAAFADRYHAVAFATPTQAHSELTYVLDNWRKHREHRAAFLRPFAIDPYSTATSVRGWRELDDDEVWRMPGDYVPLPTSPPETWLLREGWHRIGRLSAYATPSDRRSQ